MAKTGSPWRDLPDRFGNWNSILRRFNRWGKKGVWLLVLEALGGDEELEELLLDSSIVRAHQHAAGAKKGGLNQALGRSRGGFSTKIHVAVDGQGAPVRLLLTGGERHDVIQAENLIEGLKTKLAIADKCYDSDDLRTTIRKQGAKPAIPSRKGHRRQKCPKEVYQRRNIVERYFNRIKHFRRVSTRYDKTDPSYFA